MKSHSSDLVYNLCLQRHSALVYQKKCISKHPCTHFHFYIHFQSNLKLSLSNSSVFNDGDINTLSTVTKHLKPTLFSINFSWISSGSSLSNSYSYLSVFKKINSVDMPVLCTANATRAERRLKTLGGRIIPYFNCK